MAFMSWLSFGFSVKNQHFQTQPAEHQSLSEKESCCSWVAFESVCSGLMASLSSEMFPFKSYFIFCITYSRILALDFCLNICSCYIPQTGWFFCLRFFFFCCCCCYFSKLQSSFPSRGVPFKLKKKGLSEASGATPHPLLGSAGSGTTHLAFPPGAESSRKWKTPNIAWRAETLSFSTQLFQSDHCTSRPRFRLWQDPCSQLAGEGILSGAGHSWRALWASALGVLSADPRQSSTLSPAALTSFPDDMGSSHSTRSGAQGRMDEEDQGKKPKTPQLEHDGNICIRKSFSAVVLGSQDFSSALLWSLYIPHKYET